LLLLRVGVKARYATKATKLVFLKLNAALPELLLHKPSSRRRAVTSATPAQPAPATREELFGWSAFAHDEVAGTACIALPRASFRDLLQAVLAELKHSVGVEDLKLACR
jgi:hypothetical protein